MEFVAGVVSSIVAALLVYVFKVYLWPAFKSFALYKGIRVDGSWEIFENRDGKQKLVGKIKIKQTGSSISGESARSKTRDGKKSNRQFSYTGSIHSNQVTLLFEDKKGIGFDVGSYVFIVQNDGNTMIGMATFHGKTENRIVSEPRILRKVLE